MRFSVCAALLLALTAGVYAPNVIGFGMIYEDRRDPHLTLDADRIWNDLSAPTQTRQVTALSRWVDLKFFGVDAAGFHLMNLFWHLVACATALAIAWLVLPPWGAVTAGVIFALHPMQVEAVAYVSARADLLAGLGVLLAVLSAALGSLTGAVVGVLLAILAKETAVMAWGLVFLWAAWSRQAAFALKWAALSAIGALGAVFYIWTHIYAAQALTLDEAYIGQQLASVWRLLGLLVYPLGFTIDHDWYALQPWGPVALIASLALTAWSLTEGWWGRHWLAFGWLWTLICVSPRLVVVLFEGLHERHFFIVVFGWALCAGAWLSKSSALRMQTHG